MNPDKRSGYYYQYKNWLAAIPTAELSNYCGKTLFNMFGGQITKSAPTGTYVMGGNVFNVLGQNIGPVGSVLGPAACGGQLPNKRAEAYNYPLGYDVVHKNTDSADEHECKSRCERWFKYNPSIIYSCAMVCEQSEGRKPKSICDYLQNDMAPSLTNYLFQTRSLCGQAMGGIIMLIVVVLIIVFALTF